MTGRFVSAVAFFLAAAVAVPAAANESVVCVQTELQARGHYDGPLDGLFTHDTISGSSLFIAGTEFPMPALAEPTAREWCHLLRGWEQLAAGAAEPLDFQNANPGALPYGIRFDGAVPRFMRDLILEDLLWLADLGDLKASGDVASFLGFGQDVNGEELVAWLLLHVRGIARALDCLTTPTVLVDDSVMKGLAEGPAGIDVFERCDDSAQRYWGYVEHNPYTPRLVARNYDGYVLYTRNHTLPVVHLGEILIREAASTAFIDRATRLLTLFHEAYHIVGGSRHVTCSRQNLLSRTRTFGRRGTLINSIGRNCDVGLRSAYYLDGLMADLLLANCEYCNERQTNELRESATRSYMRVQLRLGSTQRAPDTEMFDVLRISEAPIRFIPPERFFELKALEYTEELGRVPPWFVALWSFAEQAAEADGDYFAEPWSPRPAVPVVVDTDLAMAWVLRALRSGADGFNTPIADVPPCGDTPIGCRDDWWDRVEILENGVSVSFALRPGTEVKLARIEIADAGPGGLFLSVAGDGHGALLHMCSIETENCVRRIVGSEDVVIGWPEALAGTYAVWVDGFGTSAANVDADPLSIMARW